MSELNKDRFAQEWSDAFEGASLEPSEHVWDKIELGIANADNRNNKKRLIYFKLLAAASIAFAAVVGGMQLYDWTYGDSDNQEIASNVNIPNQEQDIRSVNADEKDRTLAINKQIDASSKESFMVDSDTESNASNKRDVAMSEKGSDGNTRYAQLSTNEPSLISYHDEGNNSQLTSVRDSENTSVDRDYLNGLAAILEVDLSMSEREIKMVPRTHLLREDVKKNNASMSNLWAGLSLSAGSYNPNSGGASSSSALALEGTNDGAVSGGSNAPLISDEQGGSMHGFGVNMGTRLARKFVLVGGVSYLEYSTTSQSNVVTSGSGSAVSSFSDVSKSSDFRTTDNYQISNTYTSLSVPLQAGYMLVDKQFGVMMMAGVSNDFFMGKESDANSENVTTADFDSSSNGYSFYSIGGLLGTQFSYSFNEHYSLALQPQWRQSFSSFTPQNNLPSSFELSFKFNYVIN